MDNREIPLANDPVQYRTLLHDEICTVLQTTIRSGGVPDIVPGE